MTEQTSDKKCPRFPAYAVRELKQLRALVPPPTPASGETPRPSASLLLRLQDAIDGRCTLDRFQLATISTLISVLEREGIEDRTAHSDALLRVEKAERELAERDLQLSALRAVNTAITQQSATPAQREAVLYMRNPNLDKRIANGDDFAGDAWVRWTAVGRAPFYCEKHAYTGDGPCRETCAKCAASDESSKT